MQTAALEALGIADEWSYEAREVSAERFEEVVKAMPSEGFIGANVTIPHKEAALEVADVLDPVAEEIGAVNTLVFSDRGIEGYNTDAIGLRRSVRVNPAGRRALVLGAGGAARAAVWAFSQADAVVDVWNRTTERAETLLIEMKRPTAHLVENPDLANYALIVNTTSVGLHGEDPFAELPIRLDALNERQLVDMVYGEGPSRLSLEAAEHGANVVNGLEILVQQGAASLAIWLQRDRLEDRVIDAMREAAYGEGRR